MIADNKQILGHSPFPSEPNSFPKTLWVVYTVQDLPAVHPQMLWFGRQLSEQLYYCSQHFLERVAGEH